MVAKGENKERILNNTFSDVDAFGREGKTGIE
jgi:hypothetical protein